jgi:hypothetical protein
MNTREELLEFMEKMRRRKIVGYGYIKGAWEHVPIPIYDNTKEIRSFGGFKEFIEAKSSH